MQNMEGMMNMTPGMMLGIGLVWLLAIVALALGTAALIKYLRSGNAKRE